MNMISLKFQYRKVLSPKRFLRLSQKEKLNIKSVDIVPPSFSRNDFGKIVITYKNPIYKI